MENSFFEHVDLKNEAISNEIQDEIIRKFRSRGMVCIHNAKLDESQLLSLTRLLGSCVTLPSFLAPSKCDGFPEISRVANFAKNSNEVNVNYAFGNYWHHDGDFWPPGKNHIINLLYSHIVPSSGGKTGFLDTQRAYKALSSEMKSILQDLVVTVDPGAIEDFKNVRAEDQLELEGAVNHRVVQFDESQQSYSLYVPYFEGATGTSTTRFTYSDLMLLVDKPEFRYLHDWTAGDILIWDNLKFMHRAMGEITGQRLLWRAQARI